jgi:aspartyl protease/PDZ domain-containing protein
MMNNRRLIALLLIVVGGIGGGSYQFATAAQKSPQPSPVVIPFEMVTRHIMIKVKINNSAPLWFILDTGDKVAIVDLARAKSLGLNLQGEVHVGGAGPGVLTGSTVRDASLSVVGLEGNTQPVMMALPLDRLQPRFGHDIDGIIGGDFIKQFVVEIDYPAHVLRFHDKDKFTYTGPGEIIPMRLNSGGHPIIDADVTVTGRPAIKGKFVIDIGSGGALALHAPFVAQEHLPLADQKTIREIGGGGTGGKVTGRMGRIAELRIGKFHIADTPTLFSEDKGGAFASRELQGNIGGQILTKFKVFLDYARDRIILEPNASLKDLIAPASSGLRLIAEGADYKTFRVEELLEDSPAVEAGLQMGDLVLAVDGHPASKLTLSSLHETFEKPGSHKLTVRRAEQTLQITLTPRRMI